MEMEVEMEMVDPVGWSNKITCWFHLHISLFFCHASAPACLTQFLRFLIIINSVTGSGVVMGFRRGNTKKNNLPSPEVSRPRTTFTSHLLLISAY